MSIFTLSGKDVHSLNDKETVVPSLNDKETVVPSLNDKETVVPSLNDKETIVCEQNEEKSSDFFCYLQMMQSTFAFTLSTCECLNECNNLRNKIDELKKNNDPKVLDSMIILLEKENLVATLMFEEKENYLKKLNLLNDKKREILNLELKQKIMIQNLKKLNLDIDKNLIIKPDDDETTVLTPKKSAQLSTFSSILKDNENITNNVVKTKHKQIKIPISAPEFFVKKMLESKKNNVLKDDWVLNYTDGKEYFNILNISKCKDLGEVPTDALHIEKLISYMNAVIDNKIIFSNFPHVIWIDLLYDAKIEMDTIWEFLSRFGLPTAKQFFIIMKKTKKYFVYSTPFVKKTIKGYFKTWLPNDVTRMMDLIYDEDFCILNLATGIVMKPEDVNSWLE